MKGKIIVSKPLTIPSKYGGFVYLLRVDVDGEGEADLWIDPKNRNYEKWEWILKSDDLKGVVLEGLAFVAFKKLSADKLTKVRTSHLLAKKANSVQAELFGGDNAGKSAPGV